MKKNVKIFLALVSTAILIYFAFALSNLSFNPSNWERDIRILFSSLDTLILSIGICLLCMSGEK